LKQMRSDLKAFERADTYFALRSAELKRARDGRNYLALALYDRSGQINGYVWDRPEETADLLRGRSFAYVQGLAKTHNGAIILSIARVRPAGEEEVDINDFQEVVPGGVDLWMEKLHEQVTLVGDGSCRALLEAFLSDDSFAEAFKMSPAGLTVHHNYIGGLVEHTSNIISHAMHMSGKYPGILDRDLLVTGSFLHDIGKLKELSGGMTRGYTTEGRLLGHVSMGLLMVESRLQILKGFPADLALLLKHMVLSHHGSLEFGSPVRPSTPEALALHHIENTDAKMNHLYVHLKDSDPEKEWGPYDPFLGTSVYQRKFLKTMIAQRKEAEI